MTNFEVGTVLYLKQPKAEFYYFIYEATRDKICYSMYKIKDNKAQFKRFECVRDNILDKRLLSAQPVPNGQLVKKLLTVISIK